MMTAGKHKSGIKGRIETAGGRGGRRREEGEEEGGEEGMITPEW